MVLQRNRSPSRNKTQVELEIERRLNPVQTDVSGTVRMLGQKTDYAPVTIDDDYTITGLEGLIRVDAKIKPIKVTYPDLSTIGYNRIEIKKVDATRNSVTVFAPDASTLIDGDTEASIDVQNDSLSVVKTSNTELAIV